MIIMFACVMCSLFFCVGPKISNPMSLSKSVCVCVYNNVCAKVSCVVFLYFFSVYFDFFCAYWLIFTAKTTVNISFYFPLFCLSCVGSLVTAVVEVTIVNFTRNFY